MEYRFGTMEKGKRNLITDIPGVKVGHFTLADGDKQTGVTAVLPHTGDIFHEKCPAATHVINGFGKSTGLMQINELGSIETPLILTNTLSVGTAFDACVRYMTGLYPGIGKQEGTVNPVILECNDGFLNDIRALAIKPEHVFSAISAASDTFEQGAVGAGRGMSCYGLKGGIGSASRVFKIGDTQYTLGVLVMTNFGSQSDLMICGDPVGRKLTGKQEEAKGSCIMMIATDAPLSSRQLQRACRRAQSGLARTGGITEGGSGEVTVAFSTANRLVSAAPVWNMKVLNDGKMSPIFRAVTECTEESIINSLLYAEEVVGIDGHSRKTLKQALSKLS